jgi:nucleotide-binding universal stress UspA family protein
LTTTVLATAWVHTTAAACDYSRPRLGGSDRVIALAVRAGPVSDRDAGDATTVARTRLPDVDVEARVASGMPASVIRRVAATADADQLALGPRRGDPASAGEAPGSTRRAVLAEAPRPVVVVPQPVLD